jgi:DNA-binding NarL/FixJ family response regulator
MPSVMSPSVPVLREPSPDEARARLLGGPVVVLTGNAVVQSALLSVRAAHGWALLPTNADPDTIERARRMAEAGLVVLPPAKVGAPEPANSSGPHERGTADLEAVERLTSREREVLQHVVHGLHNRAIASALGISDHTVKFHLASIFGKLGVATRTEAVLAGLRRGLVGI